MPTPSGLDLVFRYFFVAGAGIGAGLLIPFVIGVYVKNKIEDGGWTWGRKNK